MTAIEALKKIEEEVNSITNKAHTEMQQSIKNNDLIQATIYQTIKTTMEGFGEWLDQTLSEVEGMEGR